MSDSTDDAENISVWWTYCSVHEGLWPHECKCGAPTNLEKEDLKKEEHL